MSVFSFEGHRPPCPPNYVLAICLFFKSKTGSKLYASFIMLIFSVRQWYAVASSHFDFIKQFSLTTNLVPRSQGLMPAFIHRQADRGWAKKLRWQLSRLRINTGKPFGCETSWTGLGTDFGSCKRGLNWRTGMMQDPRNRGAGGGHVHPTFLLNNENCFGKS